MQRDGKAVSNGFTPVTWLAVAALVGVCIFHYADNYRVGGRLRMLERQVAKERLMGDLNAFQQNYMLWQDALRHPKDYQSILTRIENQTAWTGKPLFKSLIENTDPRDKSRKAFVRENMGPILEFYDAVKWSPQEAAAMRKQLDAMR